MGGMALMADELTIEEAIEAVNNPKTRGATLYAITARYPRLWASVANHPNAYPELLDWLWDHGGPDVQTIVGSRRAEESSAAAPSTDGQPIAVTDFDLDTSIDSNQASFAYNYQPNKSPHNNHTLIFAIIAGVIILILAATLTTWSLANHNATVDTPPVISIVTATFYTPVTITTSTSQIIPTNSTTDSAAPIPETSTTYTTDPDADAKYLLDMQLAQDSSSVANNLQDRWTTQLSAKKYGVQWEGHKWTYQDIWNEFTALRNQYPSAVLVRGNQYSSFSLGPEWYITASGVVFPDADAALSWCTSQGLTDGYCFAVRITNTHGSNTKHNR